MDVPDDIKSKIDERYAVAPYSSISRFLRDNPDVDEFLVRVVEEVPFYRTKRLAFSCIARGIFEPVKCLRCGKELDICRYLKNGVRFCSRQCSQSSVQRIEKMRNTSLERYGCTNAMKNSAVKEKLRQSNMAKYGVGNVFQIEEVKGRTRNTNLVKYGSELYVCSKDWRDKTIATNMMNFGVEFPGQDAGIKEKIRRTNEERYGGIAPACSDAVIRKMQETNVGRYGDACSLKNTSVDAKRQYTWNDRYGGNPLSNAEVISVRNATNLERYGSECYSTSPVYFAQMYDAIVKRFEGKVEPLFKAGDYHGINCGESYPWRCCLCGAEFTSRIYTTGIDDERLLPRCPVCHPRLSGVSLEELEVLEFVKSLYDGEVVHDDRTVLAPRELDIYIPDKRVAIEFDGLYWHSGKDEHYHVSKTDECMNKDIHLVHVFEDEWNDKQEIVKDRIRSILGVNERVYARKCIVKEIGSRECNEFLDDNHLQGRDTSSIRYGLYHENGLVAVMTFGRPRFNRKYDYELIRYCSRLGYNVVGGASKLLSHFRKNNTGSIISYADRRYSDGNLYEKLGFKMAGCSSPNYWYVKGNEKLSRYRCQKSRLAKILENFDESLSEHENMLNNGYEKFYDCGNYVYVMDKF